MCSLSANNRAAGNQPVISLAGKQPSRGNGKLPRARDPNDIDVIERDSVLDERFEGAIDELLYDGLVEAAGEYDHPSSDAARRTVKLSHLREAGGERRV